MAKKPSHAEPAVPAPAKVTPPAPSADTIRIESLKAEMDRLYALRLDITANPADTTSLLLKAEQALRDEYERLTGAPPAPRA